MALGQDRNISEECTRAYNLIVPCLLEQRDAKYVLLYGSISNPGWLINKRDFRGVGIDEAL